MVQIKIDLTTKQKLSVVTMFFLILVTVISIWIIVPVIKDIRILNDQIYNQRLSLEKKYVQRFSMRRIIANFREINENIDEVLTIFLPKNGEIPFITKLEELSDENNISLKIFLLPEEKKTFPDGKQKFDLTLSIEGSYENIIKFINDIEKINTYVLIDSISFTHGLGNTDDTINASLKGYVYKNINL